MPDPAGLATAEARALLDDLCALGVRRLCASGGELTLRRDWTEIIARAAVRFEQVLFVTNGWLRRDLRRAVRAVPNSRRVVVLVSIDGSEAVHDARRSMIT